MPSISESLAKSGHYLVNSDDVCPICGGKLVETTDGQWVDCDTCNYSNNPDKEKIYTFNEMSEDIEATGLCNHCPLPDGAKGTHLYPSGHHSCEGSHCKDAYERYLDTVQGE